MNKTNVIGDIKHADVIAILHNPKSGEKTLIAGKNIVTNAGDQFYAQKVCGESPANDFTSLYLTTAGPSTPAKDDDYSDFTVVAGSEKAKSSGYPKTNDADPDNPAPGVDIMSWLFEYSGEDGPFTDITHSFIAKAGAGGTDPILNSYKWPVSFSKGAGVTMKIFHNHQQNGEEA
ncbi:MAG: hypothetical protein JXA50_01880 [Deltaproteobacteria bacterium]|nr:hypothetical protein [Deltaproteobacteria bacterium]